MREILGILGILGLLGSRGILRILGILGILRLLGSRGILRTLGILGILMIFRLVEILGILGILGILRISWKSYLGDLAKLMCKNHFCFFLFFCFFCFCFFLFFLFFFFSFSIDLLLSPNILAGSHFFAGFFLIFLILGCFRPFFALPPSTACIFRCAFFFTFCRLANLLFFVWWSW